MPYWIFVGCECDAVGSTSYQCEHDGRCSCKANVGGDKCIECLEGFYNFPNCTLGMYMFLMFQYPNLYYFTFKYL